MYEPQVGTPLAACESLVLGFLLLYFCLFTLTLPRYSIIFRLVLAPPAIFFFWNFGYGSYEPPTQMLSAAMATIGLYGVMRVLEHSIIGLWDPIPPYWISCTSVMDGNALPYPLPQSFQGRCIYAFDVLTSLRGSSWFTNLDWNWIPRRFQSLESAPPRQFVMDSIKSLIVQYLLLDLCDTVNKSRSWDTASHYPVTSLPMLQQLIFSISVCAGTALSIAIFYTAMSAACVLCGSSPCSWPPMFDSPFLSTSLRDFWSRRWHWMFRRVFDRLSIPLVHLSKSISNRNDANNHGSTDVRYNRCNDAMTRPAIAFTLSTLLHLFIMHRLAARGHRERGATGNVPFWDSAILKFFMCQPLGLFLESTCITILANWLFPLRGHPGGHHNEIRTEPSVANKPSPQPYVLRNEVTKDASKSCDPVAVSARRSHHRWERDAITRLYAWLFLLWTGRWWADKWVCVGFFNEEEIVVPFSVWRSLWHRHWVA